MESLMSNKTWKFIDLPPDCKTIDCKWILRKELKPDGTIDKYKVRLIVKGFKQKRRGKFLRYLFTSYVKPQSVRKSILGLFDIRYGKKN